MASQNRTPLVSELGTERKIAIGAALALIIVSMAFRNERAMLLTAPAPTDRVASAFSAIIAPPAIGGPSIGRRYAPFTNARPGRRGPAAAGTGGAPARGADGAGTVPDSAASGGSAATPAAALPIESASINAPGRTSTPQLASFIGLPGGVIFGSGNATTPTDPTTPTTPTAPTEPTGPTTPVTPTDPTTPITPTDPTGPTDPVDTTPPVTTPDPGPGAVPEPSSWALMILGIGVIGASLRRRRAAPHAAGKLAAA